MSKEKKKSAADDSHDEEVDSEEEEDAEDDDEAEDEEESEEEDSDDEDSDKGEKSKKKKDDDSEDDEDSDDEDSDDDDDSDSSSSDEDELDIDKELERENQAAGKADAEDARKGFKKRDKKRKGGEGGITEERLQEILAEDRKERQKDEALRIAKGMAGSDKEAELIVAKWANRTFPKNLTLTEQMTEAFAITHAKKLIGERNEAMRALRGKRGVKKQGAASAHHDGDKAPNEPKLPPSEAASLKASGFSWNVKTRQFEKKLNNGRLLIRDNKTKQVRLAPKR